MVPDCVALLSHFALFGLQHEGLKHVSISYDVVPCAGTLGEHMNHVWGSSRTRPYESRGALSSS